MLSGYKTYITLAVLVIKLALDKLDIKIPDDTLNVFVDVGLAILAGIFRFVGKKRGSGAQTVNPTPNP